MLIACRAPRHGDARNKTGAETIPAPGFIRLAAGYQPAAASVTRTGTDLYDGVPLSVSI